MRISLGLDQDQRRAGPGRCRDIARTQARKQALGKRADVEHALAAVERLQRIERPRGVAELAVVVVLDDDRIAFARETQQLGAARSRHRAAERKLDP